MRKDWMSPAGLRWLVEAFVAANLAFLTVDIAMAHAVNSFAHPAEWIPLVWSALVPLLLAPGLVVSWRRPERDAGRVAGWVVGIGSVLVGVAGLLLHLESTFFREQSLHNLVYTAPFAAPLAYTGLGLLLVLNRTERAGSTDWARWVVALAAGGFAGNFALTLGDHEQNGFFHPTEWIAVGSAALALTFLVVLVARPRDGVLRGACAWVLGVQVIVGLLGAGLHGYAIATGTGDLLYDILHTAPAFAPLLYVDMALLAAIGLGALAVGSEAASLTGPATQD